MIYYKRKSLWKRLFSKLPEVNLPSSRGFFGFFRGLFLFILVSLALIYCVYLFAIPKYITDDKVENYLNSYLKNHSKLSLDIKNLTIAPNYKFDIKLRADELSLKYPDNKVFILLNEPDIEVDLITLFFNYIDLNKIRAKKIVINTNFTKNNRYDSFDYFDDDIFEFKDTKFKLRNIKILCDEFLLNLYDENIKKNFKLQTKKLTFSLNDVNKPVVIKTEGFVSGAEKIADFKLNFELNSSKDFLQEFKNKFKNLNYNPLNDASKFKFYTNSDINLKVAKNSVSGFINLSRLNFVLDNIKIPNNNLSLIFKGQKIKANGDFNLIKNQFIKLNLIADYSKNKYIELKLNSNEINLIDLKKIASALCKILNLKYNLDLITIEGTTTADIYLKSNFKTIVSKGFANITNAKIKDNSTGLILNDVNSNVSFDNNRINIQKTTALFDNSKFYLEGTIDDKTNLNLKINSDPLNIAQILTTLKNLPLLSHIIPELNDYIFKSGFVKANVLVSGNLNQPIIKSNSSVSNLKLFIKPLNVNISSAEVLISANPENNEIKNIFITSKNNVIQYENNKIINDVAKLKIAQNDIIIDKTQVKFDNIKADIEAVLKNYKKSPVFELNLSALLPINNNLIIIKNKTPKIFAQATLDKNKLSIKNAQIREGERDFVVISGNIYDFISDNPRFENLKISLIDRISCILPKIDNLNFDADGEIVVSNNLKNPLVTGSANLYNVVWQKYNLFIKDCALNIRNSNLEGNIAALDILNTTLYDVVFKGNLKGDILNITHFGADIFEGKIEGNASINIKNFKTSTELILKELSIRHLSSTLKQYSIAVSGRLSALLRLNFTGLDYESAINSLQGYIKFNIDNGELAQFAKLERYLQAGNILSQSILKLTLNSVISSVTKQNTGDFKTIEGTVKINSPMAEIQYINTQGTNMATHIEGRYNIINNHAILRVLGRIPQNIVNVMGNIGKFSLSQLFDNKQVEASAIEKMMSVNMSEEERAKIPELANYHNTPTREFIVIIDGLLNNNNAVKYFKWIYNN